jgi:hypothetical protein
MMWKRRHWLRALWTLRKDPAVRPHLRRAILAALRRCSLRALDYVVTCALAYLQFSRLYKDVDTFYTNRRTEELAKSLLR